MNALRFFVFFAFLAAVALAVAEPEAAQKSQEQGVREKRYPFAYPYAAYSAYHAPYSYSAYHAPYAYSGYHAPYAAYGAYPYSRSIYHAPYYY